MNITIKDLEDVKKVLEGKAEMPSKEEIKTTLKKSGMKVFEDKNGYLHARQTT